MKDDADTLPLGLDGVEPPEVDRDSLGIGTWMRQLASMYGAGKLASSIYSIIFLKDQSYCVKDILFLHVKRAGWESEATLIRAPPYGVCPLKSALRAQ